MSTATYGKVYRQEVVRLYEAVTSKSGPSLIVDVEFDDCDIYGPGVIGVIQDFVLDRCVFDSEPEALFIEAMSDRPYVGIIGLRRVKFFACRFHNVGILASREMIALFTRTLQEEHGPRSS